MKAARSPHFEAGGKAPLSFGRRRRRASRRTRRSVIIAPPQAGAGGSSATGPKLSACGACAAPRQGSSPEWAEIARARDENKIDRLSHSGRYAPRARPEGDAPKKTCLHRGSRKLPQTKSQTKRRF